MITARIPTLEVRMATTQALKSRGAGAVEGDDVVELILADHRLFEELMRALRNREEDRGARRAELADVLVAHAEAEESKVYPTLIRRVDENEEDDIEHGYEEHAEGHEVLLKLLEVDDVDSEEFEEVLEELVEAVNHHLDEEERDVLNAAREEVEDDVRADLGRAFRAHRAELLDGSPGDPRNVARLVAEADREGLLD